MNLKNRIQSDKLLGRSKQIQLNDGTRLWFKAWRFDGATFDGTDEEALNRRIRLKDIMGIIDGLDLIPVVAS